MGRPKRSFFRRARADSAMRVKALREEVREANLSPGHLLGWIGGAVVGSVVAADVLNLIHHTPFWLLAAFFVGVILIAAGAMLLRIDKRAGRTRDWAAAAIGDYKRRVQLSLDLRQRADLIADEHVNLRDWAVLVQTNPIAKGQFELDSWIEGFRRQAEVCATIIAEGGHTDDAERYRVQTGADGHLIPPAATAHGSLESLIDLLNVLPQYRASLSRLAYELLHDQPT